MSERVSPGSSRDNEVQAARSEIETAEERARQQLQRSHDELAALQRVLEPLAESTSAVGGVSGQLANLVIMAAGQITKSGAAGQQFLPVLEQLAAIARASQTAHHDLQRQSLLCRTRVEALAAATEKSRAALEPIAPAARSLAAAAASRRAEGAVQVVHVPGFTDDRADRVAKLSEDVMRLGPVRSSNAKN